MASPKQRAANRLNSLRSTGPRSDEGKSRAKLNAIKHGLSLPVDEHVFSKEIQKIAALVRADCASDEQAKEIAKRIVDFERNEAFLRDFDEGAVHREISEWGFSSKRITLAQLAQDHRLKRAVAVTFTTRQMEHKVQLKGKERTEEIKFIEDFLKLKDRSLLHKARAAKNSQLSALRYQKRAINQLVKGIWALAESQEQ